MLSAYRVMMLILIVAVLTWTVTLEINRSATIAEVASIHQSLDMDARLIGATKEAQEYAAPIVALSVQLASENAMFTEVLDRARAAVNAKDLELAQTKEALNESVEMLKEQIDENNVCIDRIRQLEDFVSQLMAKIPESERPILMEIN